MDDFCENCQGEGQVCENCMRPYQDCTCIESDGFLEYDPVECPECDGSGVEW